MNQFNTDPLIDPLVLAEANARRDAEHGNIYAFDRTRLKPGWKPEQAVRGKKLTDRVIAKYIRRGRYTEQYKRTVARSDCQEECEDAGGMIL